MAPIAQKYYINGFRSLIDFEISINRGINIICGPNGSGKTNFIEFLDFLSGFLLSGASNAISKSGGLARVFSVENLRKKTPEISFKSSGVADLNFRRSAIEIHEKPFFKYDYEVNIKFHKKTSATYISSEHVRFYRRSSSVDGALGCVFIGALSISRKSPTHAFEASVVVGPRLKLDVPYNPMAARSRSRRTKPLEDIVESLNFAELEPDISIVGFRGGVVALEAVRRSLARGRSVNILPDRARQPSDVTQAPYIDRDGSGLSSTLYHLLALSEGKIDQRYLSGKEDPEAFDMIKQWTKIIFKELEDIHVTKDMHTGKFLVYLTVGEKRQLRIPLQGLSDGTIKWLALTALLVTSGGPSSLEEPENFLHPKVQTLLVDLIRETVSVDSELSYFILSSHSETIINASRPEEIIIFRFLNNKTFCKRIENADKIKSEINRTGFGLGHYYASGAIS